MFDIKQLLKQLAAAVGVIFGPVWAAVALVVERFDIDFAAGKQAVAAAVAAAFGVAAAATGNLISQLFDRARGILREDAETLIPLVDEIIVKAKEVKENLR